MSDAAPTAHPGLTKLLVLGFLALAVAVIAAWLAPATRYEVSIYWATPVAFWLGVGLALVVSVVTVTYAARDRLAALGLVLGVEAVTAMVALPVIRGYRFYGLADSLTHLGWTAAIASGEMSAFELIYPGGHLASVLVASLGGVPVSRAMMLVVLAFFVAFLVFVPLTIRELVTDPVAVLIAGVSAFLLLPLNNIGTHRMFHPYTLGTLLFPLLLYLLFKHGTRHAEDGALPARLSAAAVVLPVVIAAVLFVHPQPALNVLIFLATIVAVQAAYRRYRPDHAISRYRSIYGQTAFLAVLFFAWNLQFWQTFNMLDGLVTAIVSTIAGTDAPGGVVRAQGTSLTEIGVTLTELFTKLFLVSAVYVVLSVGLVVGKLVRALRTDDPENHVAIAYFAFSGFTLGPFFLAHYLGDISQYFFRHLGFAMVVVTLLGASAIYALQRSLGSSVRRFGRPIAVVGLVLLLVLSLTSVYPSPYLYKHNHHASEQLMDGYAATFENAPDVPGDSEEAVWFTGIRDGPERFAEAHRAEEVRYVGAVNDTELRSDLADYLATQSGGTDRAYYLPITARDRQREIAAYRELRYSQASFRSIERQPEVQRVQSNGGYTLYYVDTDTTGG